MKIKELEKLLIEAFTKQQADEIFAEVPMEIKKLVYAKFPRGKDGLDIRGKVLLNLYKKEPIKKSQFFGYMKELPSIDEEKIKKAQSWDSLGTLIYEKKKYSPPVEKNFQEMKPKDFGEEILIFPQTYTQMRDLSNWMAGRDNSGEELGEKKADANHWCVAASDNKNFYSYKYANFTFAVVVKKNKKGKPDWNKRYLYAQSPTKSFPEFADKFNNPISFEDAGTVISEKTKKFLSNLTFHTATGKNRNVKAVKDLDDKSSVRDVFNKREVGDRIGKIFTEIITNESDTQIRDDYESYPIYSNIVKAKNFQFDFEESQNLEEFFGGNSLETISFGKVQLTESIDGFFSGLYNLKKVENFNPKTELKGCQELFKFCHNLEEAPLFDTSAMLDINYMFHKCSKLKTIPNYDFSSVKEANRAFSGCRVLKTFLPTNLSKIKDFRYGFGGCSSLTSLPSLVFTNVENLEGTFRDCSSLTHLDMSNPKAWTFTNLEELIDFSDCPLDAETKRELEKRNPHLDFKFKVSE
jgi:hypothetical protein